MIILLPSYSIEDFSVDRIDAEANQILSSWSALYHPALIERIGKLPHWDRAANPEEGNDHTLILIPQCCEYLVPSHWVDERESSSCIVIRFIDDREAIIDEVLCRLQLTEHGFDNWFVEAFYALGTAFFLSELLTRQLRYMSMLDEYQYKEKILASIKEYRVGQFDKARETLQQVFELLQQNREYFYPMQSYFIDLTLTAPTTLGDKLRDMLDENALTNLVLPTAYLQQIMREQPETLNALKRAALEGRLEMVGDDLNDVPLSLLSVSDLVERLYRSVEFYQQSIGIRPVAYARREPHYLAELPSFLVRVGYAGVLLFSTSGWKVPENRQSLLIWQSPDQKKISALTRYPFDAMTSEAFLQLPKKLGRMLEGDHSPTATYAHFPKHTSRWLRDLIVMHKYGCVMGRFYSLSSYFKTTRLTGKTEQLAETLIAKSNYLVTSAEKRHANPVSNWVLYHQLMQRCQQMMTMSSLAGSVIGKKTERTQPIFKMVRDFLKRWEHANHILAGQLYGDADQHALSLSDVTSCINDADKLLTLFSCHLGAVLTGQPVDLLSNNQQNNNLQDSGQQNDDKSDARCIADQSDSTDWGYLIINPTCSTRHMLVDVSDLKCLPIAKNEFEMEMSHSASANTTSVLLARETAGTKQVLVDVPAFGYAWVGDDTENQAITSNRADDNEVSKKSSFKKGVLGLFGVKKEMLVLAEQTDEGYFLRNEIFELRVDATTGAVMSLFLHNTRGNRLAQQVAFRFPEEIRQQDHRSTKDGNYGYSIMAADRIEIVENGPLRASLGVIGRLMHFDGSEIATFEQRIRVQIGSKIVQFEINIHPATEPGESPWDSYYATRFAWANTVFEPHIGISTGTHDCNTKFIEAPYYVDFRDGTQSLTIISHGAPYHRRIAETRLDSIIIPARESRRAFRFDVAINTGFPFNTAVDRMLPDESLVIRSPKPKIPSAWLFAIDVKNVTLQQWEPIFADANNTAEEINASKTTETGIVGQVSTGYDNPTTEPGYGYDGVYTTTANMASSSNDADDPTAIYTHLVDRFENADCGMIGIRLYFLETEGENVEFSFRSFRSIKKARVVDFMRREERTLTVPGDRVTVAIGAHEYLPVEIIFEL